MSQNKLKNLDTFLDETYGVRGTPIREEMEAGYEAFKLGVLIREARLKANLTQEELANKSETKRTYISRIENDASDIRLSTLIRIVEKGLNGKINISIDV
ncbi:MAG: helix-turn-helix transcriptional regulator [Bacteroidota bacterium]